MNHSNTNKLNILRVSDDVYYDKLDDKLDDNPDITSDKLVDSTDFTNITLRPIIPPKPKYDNTAMAPRNTTKLSLTCSIPSDSESIIQTVDDATVLLSRISKDLLDIKKVIADRDCIEKEIKTIKGDIRDLVNETMLSPRTRVLSRLDAAIGNTQMLIQTLSVTVKEIKKVSNIKEELETRDILIMKELSYLRNRMDYLSGEVDKIESEIDND